MAGLADSLKQLTASASSHDAALHESRAQIAALEVPDHITGHGPCAHVPSGVKHVVPRFWNFFRTQ